MTKTKTLLAAALGFLLANFSFLAPAFAVDAPLEEEILQEEHAAAEETSLADVENLTGEASAGGAKLSWSTVTNADSYTVYYGTSSVAINEEGYQNQILTGNVTSYEITNLTPGTTYYFAVAAEDSTGQYKGSENYSNEITIVPLELLSEEPQTENNPDLTDTPAPEDISAPENEAAPAPEDLPQDNNGEETSPETELPASGPGLALIMLASASGAYLWRKIKQRK